MTRIELPQDKRGSAQKFAQEIAQETKKTFNDSLHVFRRAAELGVQAASTIVNKLRPYAAPIAGTTVTGAAGVAAVQTFGLSGVLEAGAYTGLAAGALAGGTVATVAAVGVTVKVIGWIKEGAQAIGTAVDEKIKDLKVWLKGAAEFKKAFFATTKARAVERCEQAITTDEVTTATKTLACLQQIQERYKDDPELAAVINHVSQKASDLFQKAHAKHESELARLQTSGISTAEAKKQIIGHTHTLADKLTSDIFSAYNDRLDKGENPYAGLKADLKALEAFATDFSVQNTRRRQPIDYSESGAATHNVPTENPSADVKPAQEAATITTTDANTKEQTLDDQIRFIDEADTPEAHPSAKTTENITPSKEQVAPALESSDLKTIFGDTVIPETVRTSLLEESATSADLTALLTNELSGTRVSYDPENKTALSQAIKAVSIPANREIPHYNDLALELRDQFPEHVKIGKDTGGSIVITVGEQTITLTNRHPGLGGKVNISYNGELQGGMWNDKVADVVNYFISSGELPKLKNQPIRERVITKTLSSEEKAKTIYGQFQSSREYSITSERPFFKISDGENSVYVAIGKKQDPRYWNIYTEKDGEAVNGSPISVNDIQAEVERYLKARKKVAEEQATQLITPPQEEKKQIQPELPELQFASFVDNHRHGYPQEDRNVVGPLPSMSIEKAQTFLSDIVEGIDSTTKNMQAGSTFTGAIVTEDGNIVTAHLGDSPASVIIVGADGKLKSVTRLTQDHKPASEPTQGQSPSGTEYFDSRGYRSVTSGRQTLRIAVTRALGDQEYGDILSHEPDVSVHTLQDGLQSGDRAFLLLSSDGAHNEEYEITHQSHAQTVVEKLKEQTSLSDIAKTISDDSRDIRDNVTVLLMEIEVGKSAIAAVFDGHGGSEVSETGQRILQQRVQELTNEPTLVAQNSPTHVSGPVLRL